MAGEVKGHDAMPTREVGHLLLPEATIASPTVDEHQVQRAVALDAIVDGNSIGRVNLSVHFFVLGAE